MKTREPGSSVSVVSDYGLDDRAFEVRSPGRGKGCNMDVNSQANFMIQVTRMKRNPLVYLKRRKNHMQETKPRYNRLLGYDKTIFRQFSFYNVVKLKKKTSTSRLLTLDFKNYQPKH
jgi:hypothetical protein